MIEKDKIVKEVALKGVTVLIAERTTHGRHSGLLEGSNVVKINGDRLQRRDKRRQQPGPGPVPAWNLATANAPRRVFQLVGDPRSGLADDTSTAPFGQVTTDLVHYQPSNEVYWFKYELAGGQQAAGHRDARLSDYSRNLIYLLRAADPHRWTVPALAAKFRIRSQRVLALLALKELEAQRIEDGKLLAGPLSAYALTVHTADLHLHSSSGTPLRRVPLTGGQAQQQQQQQQQQAAQAQGRGPARLAPGLALQAAEGFHSDRVLPRLLGTTTRLHSALVAALRAHGFSGAAVRTALGARLAEAEALAAEVLGAAPAEGAGGEGAGAGGYLDAELAAYRAAVEGVVAAVEDVGAASPPLLEARRAAVLRSAAEAALQAAQAAGGAAGGAASGAGEGAAVSSSGELPEALRLQLTAAAEPLMKADNPASLTRCFLALPPDLRTALLRPLPELAAALAAAGVDMQRAARDAGYRGPAADVVAGTATAARGGKGGRVAKEAAGASRAPRLPVDAFGFAAVPPARLEALVAASDALAAAAAAAEAKLAALAPEAVETGAAAAPPPSAAMRRAAALASRYVAADGMWAELRRRAARTRRERERPPRDEAAKERLIRVLAEASRSALGRALQVEVVARLRQRKAFDEANAMAAAAAARGAADGGAAARPRLAWEAVAAYLDVRVAGRVYARGSGERHVARLPSFPAFEGYPLEQFDSVREGALSAANRALGAEQEAAMQGRFRADLLYNLGVRGEKLRDVRPGAPAWPANLASALQRPVVVYGIGPDGATQYPPLHVAAAEGGGARQRPLNEQEQVFQERRLPRLRLPYHMDRIRRKPELG
ncbi:hypothetical protein HYH03_015161 [Edaphochlamys debaryana]|uniref:Uncharacterized protein n=1 Tax=Edaphochlamys debaryana TaxID=47281 RepID=A0A835XUM4_9CHLO|nr:hypothetical protein HYH03_015161 [Edaphochlamys debaryana]|eukprot:KAG2486199.1 hypothetical protein HYH03_015161 [Edaphochlamys debaryana]